MDGNIKEIYSHIGDEESRRVFSDRLLYSLTDDFQYISDMVKHTKAAQNIRQNILQREQPVKIIFGAGKFGKWFYHSFPDLGWTCFVDNHVYGNTLCGLPVISFNELCSKHNDAFIYVATTLYHKAEDIWELPTMILSLCPDYKLYLRHYSFTAAETVLYAV